MYFRGVRFGLFVGLGVATSIASITLGFSHPATLSVFGVTFLLGLPMIIDIALEYKVTQERIKRIFAREHGHVIEKEAQLQRIKGATHLSVVSQKDDVQ